MKNLRMWATGLGYLACAGIGYLATHAIWLHLDAQDDTLHDFEILGEPSPDASKFNTRAFEQSVARLATEQGIQPADLLCVAHRSRERAGANLFVKATPAKAYKLRDLADQAMQAQTKDFRPGHSGVGNMLRKREDGTIECAPIIIGADGTVYDQSKGENPPPDFRLRD